MYSSDAVIIYLSFVHFLKAHVQQALKYFPLIVGWNYDRAEIREATSKN
jgi:hypothetical protein